MSEIRLVVDTNVFIGAGFRRSGYSAKMLDNIRNGKWRLIWHLSTRRETERIVRKIPVLSNEILDGLFRMEDEFKDRLKEQEFGFISDPEDRKFAALAVAAAAPLISNDIHLLTWHDRLPISVETPAAFMRKYGQDSRLFEKPDSNEA